MDNAGRGSDVVERMDSAVRKDEMVKLAHLVPNLQRTPGLG